MADYSVSVLTESQVSITGGIGLDGITQGDGSHLVGEFITLGSGPLTTLNISDGGSDTNFDDNDGNQTLNGAQTLDGILYADGTRIEAEYQFVLRDNTTGETYQVLGVNVFNSSPSFGTVEGLAFVGSFPPRGIALEVISAAEGPGSLGQPPIDAGSLVPCFTAGTRIAVLGGEKPIEQLRVEDHVATFERGFQPIRWIGCRKLAIGDLSQNQKLLPVRILAGALGNGLPNVDLLVSRQHRMLVKSKIAERMFGVEQVLLPAIHLTGLPGVFIDEATDSVEYFHLLFDQHEIIYAEGAPTESLYTGPEALSSLNQLALEEILTIFPQLAERSFAPQAARFIPSGKQNKRLVARHVKNKKPLSPSQR